MTGASAGLSQLVFGSAGPCPSEAGASADAAASALPKEWFAYPYHRLRGGKMRKFRLIPFGTTHPSKALRCELCSLSESTRDPLYPDYQLEWAPLTPKQQLKHLHL